MKAILVYLLLIAVIVFGGLEELHKFQRAASADWIVGHYQDVEP